jgi:hypothetical protein
VRGARLDRTIALAWHWRGRIDEPAPAVLLRDDSLLPDQFANLGFAVARRISDLLDRPPVRRRTDCRPRRIKASRLPQFGIALHKLGDERSMQAADADKVVDPRFDIGRLGRGGFRDQAQN